MATKLSSLTLQSMNLGANHDVSQFISTWVNWAIQEIWNDRPWSFRRREMAPVSTTIGDDQVALPDNFDMPDNFRLLTPTADARPLPPLTDDLLKRTVADPENSATGTPLVWRPPIDYDGTNYLLRVYPPPDKVYGIGGDIFITHPLLSGSELTIIPSKWDDVIVARAIVYIKEYEDETQVAPWERTYGRALARMRNGENRRAAQLPGWKSERQLKFLDRALRGIANDVDLRR